MAVDEEQEFDENEDWLTDQEGAADFNWQWREVIKHLMDGLPGYQAYARAYEIDITPESGRRVAEASYSRLLRNVKFRQLWQRILTEVGFSDEIVDTELFKLITGKTVENAVRQRAIAHYNELKGRITKNVKFDGRIKTSPFDGLNEDELRTLAAGGGNDQS